MTAAAPRRFPTVGRVRRDDPALDAAIAPEAAIEVLADGFVWSEGPVWLDRDGGFLLFSDVPANRMWRWSERDGASVFLEPSGYDGPDPSGFREPGSNGLIRGPDGTVLMCDHGARAVSRFEIGTRTKVVLADRFEGRRFNSPNDLVRASDGAIYFTDPPYGLEGLNASPLKELAHNGVYRLTPDGTVTLEDATLTFPNGIVLSPDERTVYVAVSDPACAIVWAYDRGPDGRLANRRVFLDLTPEAKAGAPGDPDGMAVDRDGRLYVTGPGGVHVVAADGRRLGLIETGSRVANCAFGEDGRTLFLAAHHRLARIRTRATGLGFD
jgi:gluconolactonase